MKSITSFFLQPETLESVAVQHSQSYARARPFPHIILDNLFPEEMAEGILDEFPAPQDLEWRRHEHRHSKKLASEDETQLGPFTRHVLPQLNSSVFLHFLEVLTGIDGLIPDPYLWGGGLHQIERGGFLGIHADFNKHPKLKLDRRLNLLVYLNKNWKEEYGGHLQLWSRDMKRCEQKILPLFNRSVIFSTTDFSFHGHPDPLTCPEGQSRKSLALYYYSNGRPAEEISGSHSTLYQNRPGEKKEEASFVKSFLKKVRALKKSQ